jgi:hypothetical protein
MADSDKLSKEDLRALARELDSTGNRDVVEPEPKALEAPEGDMDSTPEVHLSQEEAEKEYLKQHPAEAEKLKLEDKTAESSDTIDDVEEPKSKEQKDKDRLDKNWKRMQEREAAARALMDEAIQAKAELAKKERAQLVKTKPADLMDARAENPDGSQGYSVRQYQDAAKALREEGNIELALEAEGKARDTYTNAFKKIWLANLETLAEEEPDLTDSKKPISIKCNQILDAMPFLKTLPDGCKYAYRIAQGDSSKSMISELKAENQKLKKEVEKLNYSTRLTGSGPAHYSGGDKEFDSMSKKDQKAHLRHMAHQADMGR